MTGRESTEPLDPAQIMQWHRKANSHDDWCAARSCPAPWPCLPYRLAEALAASRAASGILRARVQRARTWIVNAVDGAAVGFETKQQMLDYLAGDTDIPSGLCGDRQPHESHLVEYAAVASGPMRCHADQSKRVPFAIEKSQSTTPVPKTAEGRA